METSVLGKMLNLCMFIYFLSISPYKIGHPCLLSQIAVIN
jgi:hypothetical protein